MSKIYCRLFHLKNLRLCKNYSTNKSSCYPLLSSLISKNVRSYSKMAEKTQTSFKGVEDKFKGVTVDSSKENFNTDILTEKLRESLKIWESLGNRGIWFKISIEKTEWIPILVKHGFDFHHANKGYVMMYKWLPVTPCTIPSFAHTMIAVGGLVLNDNSEILAVKQRHFIESHWKFPGGLVEPGEDLISAGIREVKEETDVDAEFISLVTLGQSGTGMFSCSDMYITMAMRALSNSIKKCEKEILDCQWIKLDEYLHRKDVSPFNKMIVKAYFEQEKRGIKIGFKRGFHKASQRAYTQFSVNCDKK